MKRQIFYSSLTDNDFAGVQLGDAQLPDGYKYEHGRVYRAVSSLVYNVIAKPVAYAVSKLRYGVKVVGRQNLSSLGKSGVFVYGNHVLETGDAFHPSIAIAPKRMNIVTNANITGIKGIGCLAGMLGALPLPTSVCGWRSFLQAMSLRLKRGEGIMIYPERHIWPYYTEVRPFDDKAFAYPVMFNAPVLALTTVFEDRPFRRLPSVTLYIDGPFYPDPCLSNIENRAFLHEKVSTAMVARTELSECDLVNYMPKGVFELYRS